MIATKNRFLPASVHGLHSLHAQIFSPTASLARPHGTGHRARRFEDGMFEAVSAVGLRCGNALGGAGLNFDLGARYRLIAGVTVQVDGHGACVHDTDQLEQV